MTGDLKVLFSVHMRHLQGVALPEAQRRIECHERLPLWPRFLRRGEERAACEGRMDGEPKWKK